MDDYPVIESPAVSASRIYMIVMGLSYRAVKLISLVADL